MPPVGWAQEWVPGPSTAHEGKQGEGGRQDRARTKLTAPEITAVRWQDSRDPWELLKGRLYICIYIIARGSQRGILYTHIHTDTQMEHQLRPKHVPLPQPETGNTFPRTLQSPSLGTSLGGPNNNKKNPKTKKPQQLEEKTNHLPQPTKPNQNTMGRSGSPLPMPASGSHRLG